MTSDFINGRVKFFNIESGFGFVRNSNTLGNDFFLHVSVLEEGYLPLPGDLVSFRTKQTRRGTSAIDVRFVKRADKKLEGNFTKAVLLKGVPTFLRRSMADIDIEVDRG